MLVFLLTEMKVLTQKMAFFGKRVNLHLINKNMVLKIDHLIAGKEAE